MWRRLLIVFNYIGLAVFIITAILGVMISRGQGFENHFYVALASMVVTVPTHVGSGVFLALHPSKRRLWLPLTVLNYVAAGFYLWVTYAGFMIRQGISFDYHFQISLSAFSFTALAHILTPLYLTLSYRQVDSSLAPEEGVPQTQA